MTTFFHCIPEGCGKVFYRPYLAPVVRWRYPGEDWREIEADDYSIDQLPAQCCGSWDITVSYSVPGCNGIRTYSGTTTKRIPYGTFRRLEYVLDNPFADTVIQIIYFDCNQNIEKKLFVWSSSGKSSVIPNCGDPLATHDLPGSTYEVVNAVQIGGSDAGCTFCSFTVYKNQQIVHNETRQECPEVEVLPCRLSDTFKEIEVEKLIYYQGIEVVNFARDTIFTVPIPPNCLNIYKTDLQPSIIPLPDIYPDYTFVAQICSDVGCPPPEYEVICGCDSCEFCPPGTCPVLCQGVICCHEKTTGKAIKSIPVEQYCGEIN